MSRDNLSMFPIDYIEKFNRIKNVLNSSKYDWQEANNKSESDFYSFVQQNVINLSTTLQHYKPTRDGNKYAEFFYTDTYIQKFFTSRHPTIGFLIGYCHLMNISIDEALKGNLKYLDEQDIISINSKTDYSMYKFLQNDGVFYIYFPSTNSDKTIIHESILKINKPLDKANNSYEATLSFEIQQKEHKYSRKIYKGSFQAFRRQTASLILYRIDVPSDDYMLISLFNNEDPSSFYGLAGYRIDISSSNTPSFTKCVFSTSKLTDKMTPCQKNNNERFLGLFSLDNDKVLVTKQVYMDARQEANLPDHITPTIKNVFTDIAPDKLNQSILEVSLSLSSMEALDKKYNSKNSKNIKVFISIIKKRSLLYCNSLCISKDDNRMSYKFLKYIEDMSAETSP